MLWLALLLPAWPLQLAERALPAGLALVVTDGPPQRPVVLCCNDLARAAGIGPGMKLAAAQALVQPLAAVARAPAREAAALHELACWAWQFSAQITPPPDATDAGLLIEIGGSRRLFGGTAALQDRLLASLGQLGYHGCCAHAATPRAAWWLAVAQARGGHCPPHPDLAVQLAPLPVSVLDWDAATTDTLRTLGLTRLGDLLRLPRAAFARRFGPQRLDQLDRACGRRADPLPLFTPPAHFHARLELPADLTHTAQLLPAAQRLLAALEGFLRGHAAGTGALTFEVTHPQRRTQPVAPTRITLALAAPERDAVRLGRLLAERLARVTLPAPAVTLALEVATLQPFAAHNTSLLPQAAGTGTDWLQLAETLHARLGSARVFQLQAVDDHRPEHALRRVPLTLDPDSAAAATPPLPPAPRPLLLFDLPRPLAEHQAALIAGPERIEAGWWDLGTPGRTPVHRDYYVARAATGQLLWVFRELAAPHRWFVHGVFA